MTLGEAIKVLKKFRIADPGEDFEEIDEAILLSIEALKWRKHWERVNAPLKYQLLPGETKAPASSDRRISEKEVTNGRFRVTLHQ